MRFVVADGRPSRLGTEHRIIQIARISPLFVALHPALLGTALAVVSDSFRGTGFHRFLSLFFFFGVLRLARKEGMGFAFRITQKVRSLIHAEMTGYAGLIHIPLSGRVFGLFNRWIGHSAVGAGFWLKVNSYSKTRPLASKSTLSSAGTVASEKT